MTLKDKLNKLASEKSTPCVTISLNTHRTHPDNAKDEVMLKNLLTEAENRLIDEFGKRPITSLLEKIENLPSEIDHNYNYDSLHIFLSNDTKEVIKSTWPTSNEGVHISDTFAVRSIIKSYNRSENYLLMAVSQSGVRLYEALNDEIIQEVKNEDFPFSENMHYNTNSNKASDSSHLDDLVREFLNKVDKALVKVHQSTELHCVVICTEDNYSRLQQVADRPLVYIGTAAIDYNKTEPHHLIGQSWKIIKSIQKERRTKDIAEIKEAVAHGKVLTDLQEIFQASIEGRGKLLVIHEDFSQSVKMLSERSFELVTDSLQPNVIDDIASKIAWEVLSKKGHVVFTYQDEIKEIGKIVLKTRY